MPSIEEGDSALIGMIVLLIETLNNQVYCYVADFYRGHPGLPFSIMNSNCMNSY